MITRDELYYRENFEKLQNLDEFSHGTYIKILLHRSLSEFIPLYRQIFQDINID
jgi:hypothetical protein